MRCGELHAILKIYPDSYDWKLAKEVHVYGLLHTIGGVPVPRVLHADDSRQIIDRGHVVMTRIEGDPLPDVVRDLVTGIIDVENAIAGDPVLDIAKTDFYSIEGAATKLNGLVAGYGTMPAGWPEIGVIYRLYHALVLWDWFCSNGELDRLPDLDALLRRLAGL